jgi:3'-phosphoadenosine 5'-phosphosulfate sulfotransferase (PAPS reductase)/FAD synthetase
VIINHFGLSSGKDSTALWGWAINDSGYPKESIRGSFCDTENEYQEVYDQITKLSEYGVKRGVAPVRTLRSEGFLNLAIRKKRFPSARARFCTEVLKMLPSKYYIQELWLDGHEVICHSGVRGDESTERSMMDAESFDGFLGCVVRRPLLKNTIADVWAMHKKYGLPINPLYLQGRKRVGCMLCCMSRKQDIRITAKTHPEVIDMYREWEKVVGKIHGKEILSFFSATMIPERFRSMRGLVRTRDSAGGKAGDTYSMGTIDDVVEWSKTLQGGKQVGFDFMYEEDDSHLPCQSGYCE